jgi:hypothetical protein
MEMLPPECSPTEFYAGNSVTPNNIAYGYLYGIYTITMLCKNEQDKKSLCYSKHKSCGDLHLQPEIYFR